MGPTRCPETSVKDYRSTLRNIPEERRAYVKGDYSIYRIFSKRLIVLILILFFGQFVLYLCLWLKYCLGFSLPALLMKMSSCCAE
jgi:hypothetical protein